MLEEEGVVFWVFWVGVSDDDVSDDDVSEVVMGAKEEEIRLVTKLEEESESEVLELGVLEEDVGSLVGSLEDEVAALVGVDGSAALVLVTVLVMFDMVNCRTSSLPRCLYISMSVMENPMIEEVSRV